jgi:hypothetical protein
LPGGKKDFGGTAYTDFLGKKRWDLENAGLNAISCKREKRLMFLNKIKEKNFLFLLFFSVQVQSLIILYLY